MSPYTRKLLRIRRLQLAGYPLTKNDLTLHEWLDLGAVKEMFEKQPDCPLQRKK